MPVIQQGTASNEESSTVYQANNSSNLKSNEKVKNSVSQEDEVKKEESPNLFKDVTFKNDSNKFTTFADIFNVNKQKQDDSKVIAPLSTNNSSLDEKPKSEAKPNPFTLFGAFKAENNTKSIFGSLPSKEADQVSTAPQKNPFSIFSANKSNESSSEAKDQSQKTVFQFNRFTSSTFNSESQTAGSEGNNPGKDASNESNKKDSSETPGDRVKVAEDPIEEPNCRLLFHKKAKLFKFYPSHNQWRTRGDGLFKVLVPNDMEGKKTVRFVLRRKPIMQISCNCLFTAENEFVAMKRADMTSFVVLDYSDSDKGEQVYYSIRFASVEDLEEFKKSVTDITLSN